MAKPTGNESLPLLNSLASAWSNGRGTALCPVSEFDAMGKLKTEGPGFLYRWNNNLDPVLVTFLPDGQHRISTGEKEHLLFIGAGCDGLAIGTARRPHSIIKASDRSQQLRLTEIIDEARNCSDSQFQNHHDTLSTISAAQRLVALGHEAYSNDKSRKNGTGIPANDRFVTELHEWLADELENSVKLGDAARHFNKSPRQLIRILKKTTGSGFAEHLTIHRLILARTLLMRTDESIMTVAKKSGFNSREQFIRSFSKSFQWTPLQFRKAWNKASLSNGDLDELCRIPERQEVIWQSTDQSPARQDDGKEPIPHTLVVANALHEIVELFSIDDAGKRTRVDVLDRGAMSFIKRDTRGSRWLVRASGNGFERSFITGDKCAIAIISPGLKSR